MIEKMRLLITNPKVGCRLVLPYAKNQARFALRNLFELIGVDWYSKPYSSTDELVAQIGWRDGFFVQCGGYDGYSQDPTYYLERFRGWRGIIFEPTTRFFDCRRIRKNSEVLRRAVVGDDSVKEVTLTGCEAMTIIDDEKYQASDWNAEAGRFYESFGKKCKRSTAEATTLTKVLVERGVSTVDLLVLDTEGSEADILRGLDFSKITVKYVLVEIHTAERRAEIESLIGQNLVAQLSYADYLYKVVG